MRAKEYITCSEASLKHPAEIRNRLIASRIVTALTDLGHDAALLVPEQEDIPLPERCRRVNERCRLLGRDNVILISIHANAAGRGDRWYDATGWCAYISGASY